MNKITVTKENIAIKKDDRIDIDILDNDYLGVKTLKIICKKTSRLEIVFKEEVKLNICIDVLNKSKLTIFDNKEEGKYKIKYLCNVYGDLSIYKVNDNAISNEKIIYNLEEEGSKVFCVFKTISQKKEDYTMIVNHKKNNTISIITNNGVNLKDELKFNVSGFVPKNIKNCILKQDNRIINLSNDICQIKPNLFIDEYDVTASHSAHIGGFDKRQMFYLQSRGINEAEAKRLIIRGFLTNNFDRYSKNINKILDKYWR